MESSVLPSAKSSALVVLAGILLLLLGSFPAQANMKAAYGLSPLVYDVKGMGQWSMGSKSGQVRLVITRDKKRDEVYLQWVAWNEGEPVHVESTIAVTEINKDDRYSITFIRREVNDGVRQIVLGLEDRRTKDVLRAFIQVKEMGLYHCQIKR